MRNLGTLSRRPVIHRQPLLPGEFHSSLAEAAERSARRAEQAERHAQAEVRQREQAERHAQAQVRQREQAEREVARLKAELERLRRH